MLIFPQNHMMCVIHSSVTLQSYFMWLKKHSHVTLQNCLILCCLHTSHKLIINPGILPGDVVALPYMVWDLVNAYALCKRCPIYLR